MAVMSEDLHAEYGIPEWYWDSPDRDEIADLVVRRVGGLLMAGAPDGWRRLDLAAAVTVSDRQVVVTAVLPDGYRQVEPPADLDFLITELRELKNEVGLGTWLSVRLTVDPDGTYAVWFNFAQDPRWDPPLAAESYRRDLDAFPRDDQWVPHWYRERMAGRQPVGAIPIGVPDLATLEKEMFSELTFLLPAGWETLRLNSNGPTTTAEVTSVLGDTAPWQPPAAVTDLLAQHRAAARVGWISARLEMRHPAERRAEFVAAAPLTADAGDS